MASTFKHFLASPTLQFLCVRFSSLLTVVGFGLFIYYGIKVVLPASRGLHFQETECFVNYSKLDGEAVCECVASFTQRSCYPCLKIYVVFNTEKNEELPVSDSSLTVKTILYRDLWSINEEVYVNNPEVIRLYGGKLEHRKI